MKLLLSSIGSRGDVQPLLALALELRALGHTPVLSVAPNFRPWVESFGIDFRADWAGSGSLVPRRGGAAGRDAAVAGAAAADRAP